MFTRTEMKKGKGQQVVIALDRLEAIVCFCLAFASMVAISGANHVEDIPWTLCVC